MEESSVEAGIDWVAEVHAVCLLGGDGKVVERFDVTHDSQALHVLVSRFRNVAVANVAIARGDRPVAEGIGRCRAHSVHRPVTSDQSLMDPLLLGRQQGRPARRIRPRGHAADRRSPVATAARRSPGN